MLGDLSAATPSVFQIIYKEKFVLKDPEGSKKTKEVRRQHRL